MYPGYWFLIAGLVLVYRTWSPLLFLGLCLPGFYRRARCEETALETVFDAEWRAFAARVPMFMGKSQNTR